MKKSLLSIFTMILMSLFVCPKLHADASGKFGDNITWYFHDYGTLVIEGTGEIYSPSNSYPWKMDKNFDYKNDIKTVIFSEGI
ncbi:MAG: hypothetical protein MR030_08590, partial [Bacteroidales bacterium]|nr:hypothetical protein [Bacteroidales bacterium]